MRHRTLCRRKTGDISLGKGDKREKTRNTLLLSAFSVIPLHKGDVRRTGGSAAQGNPYGTSVRIFPLTFTTMPLVPLSPREGMTRFRGMRCSIKADTAHTGSPLSIHREGPGVSLLSMRARPLRHYYDNAPCGTQRAPRPDSTGASPLPMSSGCRTA